MLAQILLQLQQGQAQIAQDTREGLEKLASGFKESMKRPGTVDVKGIGKPDALKGTHDEVQKVWKSWSYKFETWFCSQWPSGQEALDWARGKSDDPVEADDLLNSAITDIDAIDSHLHVALVSLTSGMPYDVVFNSRKKCGLDAWRRLCSTYEPQNNRTNIRLLRRILNPPRATIPTMRSAIDKLEADIVEYESRGQPKPSDETLRAILLAMVPENLEEHLELNIQRFDTYKKMRAEVVSFLEQKASKALVDDGGAAPMELDYVGGQGKGGKGQGKPNLSQVRCHTCGKLGHMAKDCWQKGSKGSPSSGSNSKGYPKGSSKGFKGKSKDKGGKKGKGKGKMKGKQQAMEGEDLGDQVEETWQESAGDGNWPEEQWEEPGEQGALCPTESRAESARHSDRGVQMRDKNWFTMPFVLVCNQSSTHGDGTFHCGHEHCRKSFDSPWKFKQHLWSKAGSEGHPDEAQLEAWQHDPYDPPDGYEINELWEKMQPKQFNQWLDRVSRFVSTSGSEGAKSRSRSLHRKKQSGRERAPLPRTPQRKKKEEEVPIKAKPTKPPTLMTPRAKPAPKSPPSRPMSSRGHSAPPTGFTPGAVANLTQALVLQRLEEVKKLTEAIEYLPPGDPARDAILASIQVKRDEIEKIRGERAKAIPKGSTRKYSSRQERDKAVSTGRVAYIKEKQRLRAAKHRASSVKERAIQNVARQEELEEKFNRPGQGQKEKVFPLATGALAGELQAVPLSKAERGSGREEIPEVKKRRLELPPSEVRRKEKEREKRKKQKAEVKEEQTEERFPQFIPVGSEEAEQDPGSADAARQDVDWWSGKDDKDQYYWHGHRDWTGYRSWKQPWKSEKEWKAQEDKSPRPVINFGDRRVKSALDVRRGRMFGSEEAEEKVCSGPESSEHESEHQVDEENVDYTTARSEASEDEQTRKARGYLGSFELRLRPSNNGPSGKEWTRVDFIVDSGASDSTLPAGVLPDIPLGPPKGFKEFAMADGRVVPNLGSKAVRMAFQNGLVLNGNFTVVDTSKPLISVGKLISQGHAVSMTPSGGHILLKDGKTKITIYHRNGVWKIPVWVWNPQGFPGQEEP